MALRKSTLASRFAAVSITVAIYAVAAYFFWESWRLDFLLVGDVTIDLVHGHPVAGGA